MDRDTLRVSRTCLKDFFIVDKLRQAWRVPEHLHNKRSDRSKARDT